MHSFIRHITGPRERIIMIVRLHWIYALTGFVWMAALAALGMGLDLLLWQHFGSSVPVLAGNAVFGVRIDAQTPMLLYLFGGCGAMIFLIHMIKYLATEVALTSQRLIYKTGLIFVEVEEIDIVEIHAEHVHHGFLGRFLGYGEVEFDSRFVDDIRLPAVKKPYKLIRAMHTARSRRSDVFVDDGRKKVGTAEEDILPSSG